MRQERRSSVAANQSPAGTSCPTLETLRDSLLQCPTVPVKVDTRDHAYFFENYRNGQHLDELFANKSFVERYLRYLVQAQLELS